MNFIRVFPFFISFFCCNEISKKSSIKEDTRKMENCKANHILDRNSHRRCSIRKDVHRNFAKFTGKNTYVRVSLCQACNFIKKRLWHRCFTVNFAKCLRTPFLQNTSGQLLLFRVNRVSDYYAKSIYIKVFQWGLQPGTSPVVSFSRIFSIHFLSSKIRPPVLFSYNLTFNSNW